MPPCVVTSLSHNPPTYTLSFSLFTSRVVKMLWKLSYLREFYSLICLLRSHIPSLDTRSSLFLCCGCLCTCLTLPLSLSLGIAPSLSARLAPSPSFLADDSCFLATAALNNGLLLKLFIFANTSS